MSSYKDTRVAKRLGIKQGTYDRLDPPGKGALTNLAYYSYYRSKKESKERANKIIANSRRRQGLPTEEPPKRLTTVNGVLAAMRRRPEMQKGIEVLREREGEFDSPMTMELAGIAQNPEARAHFDAEMHRIWADTEPPLQARELVIGAGFHAAVYCAVRVAMGKPKPLVIEASDKVGGAFAPSMAPSFYLNSRNRPGMLGIPGRAEALNVLPGAPIQPSHLSGDEYQRNSDVAFAIRCSLAMNAKVVTGWKVDKIGRRNYYGGALCVTDPNGRRIGFTRCIIATGLGKERRPASESDRVLTFSQLMARMDEPFPLRGMKKVAVVGAGDSGKTAIEALTGQGPTAGMSVAALDYPEAIDWYGVPESCATRDTWAESSRPRYKGIARNLPSSSRSRDRNAPPRIRPKDRAKRVSGAYDGVLVNGKRYDHVIWCAGYGEGDGEADPLIDQIVTDATAVVAESREVARTTRYRNVFRIGPAAKLALDPYEVDALPAVPENVSALFRYADRSATFAATVDENR